MLNQHANKDGKFWCVSTLDLLSTSFWVLSLIRMSKSSTAAVSKNLALLPAKSAWLRGPPLSATVPNSCSQFPALPSATPIHQTHSHCPSALGQAVPIKDGVSVPRSNVSTVKQVKRLSFFVPLCSSQCYFSPFRFNSHFWLYIWCFVTNIYITYICSCH